LIFQRRIGSDAPVGTEARYQLPALFIVSNYRSNFNDEIHQESIAKARSRPVENRRIGQRINFRYARVVK